jgi:hypothetical protein
MGKSRSTEREQNGRQVFPLYPILFGVYPVLALTAFNIAQIDFSSAYRSIALSIVFALGLFLLLRLVLRNWTRAAFLSLLLLILFFSYGHMYTLIKNTSLFGVAAGRHRFLLVVWAVLGGLAVWVSTRQSTHLAAATSWLNILSALLLIFSIFQIVRYEVVIRMGRASGVIAASAGASSGSHQPYPDIYYIIPDAYGRSDQIKAVYNYDDSAFLEALTKRGFYIANCSQSNYAYTNLSLASSLNMDYLDKFSATDDEQVSKLIQTDAVREFLKARGYTIIAFDTGYRWTQLEDADIYYKNQSRANTLTPFEFLLLQTTLARIPLDYMNMTEHPASYDLNQYNRIVYDLGALKNIPHLPQGPKFVFAHLVIPHWPWVYGPNGEYIESGLNPAGYQTAVAFISRELLQVVDSIQANSKTPPVIIIQGDHGVPKYSSGVQRMPNLNAYYLPGGESDLYPTITPVNTFRIVLNTYFGQSFPLLKDVSWYSPINHQYQFEVFQNQCSK